MGDRERERERERERKREREDEKISHDVIIRTKIESVICEEGTANLTDI